MRKLRTLLAAASLLACSAAVAQDRGRTDGPEGSEIGKGGYVPAQGGPSPISLQIDAGGAFTQTGPQFSPPFFVGFTATYWGTEYYRLDLSGAWIPANDAIDIFEGMLGPSFVIWMYPMAMSLGVQAGGYVPTHGDSQFVISPRVGIDFFVESRFKIGLNGNWDIAPANFDASIVRAYLNLGYRF